MPNTVIVTNAAEYRPDGSYWFNGTVNGTAFAFRWNRPLDTVPGGQAVAQALSDRYNRAVTALSTLLSQTVVIPPTAMPPIAYSVVFAATAAATYAFVGPHTVQVTATVNGAATPTVVPFLIEDIIEASGAQKSIPTLVSNAIAKNYADSLRWLGPYIGTFTTN